MKTKAVLSMRDIADRTGIPYGTLQAQYRRSQQRNQWGYLPEPDFMVDDGAKPIWRIETLVKARLELDEFSV